MFIRINDEDRLEELYASFIKECDEQQCNIYHQSPKSYLTSFIDNSTEMYFYIQYDDNDNEEEFVQANMERMKDSQSAKNNIKFHIEGN